MAEDVVPVVIASGCPAYAHGLADFLGEPPLVPVVVHSVDSALRMTAAEEPAMVVVDDWLVDGSGEDLVFELRRRHPGARVMFVVGHDDHRAQMEALSAGAAGCLARSWEREMVCEAVADALRGVSRLDLDVVRSLADMVRRGPGADTLLTDQERVVLRLMRQHLTYKEIAQQLGLSWHTVRTHAQSVLRKSGVHSRRDLQHAPAGLARAGGSR
ncbi:MAG: response regulator transcription factor [Thermoleophilia bacterium]|nr:response regulator transcription factor [Thermoleophilia bacterium]